MLPIGPVTGAHGTSNVTSQEAVRPEASVAVNGTWCVPDESSICSGPETSGLTPELSSAAMTPRRKSCPASTKRVFCPSSMGYDWVSVGQRVNVGASSSVTKT